MPLTTFPSKGFVFLVNNEQTSIHKYVKLGAGVLLLHFNMSPSLSPLSTPVQQDPEIDTRLLVGSVSQKALHLQQDLRHHRVRFEHAAILQRERGGRGSGQAGDGGRVEPYRIATIATPVK